MNINKKLLSLGLASTIFVGGMASTAAFGGNRGASEGNCSTSEENFSGGGGSQRGIGQSSSRTGRGQGQGFATATLSESETEMLQEMQQEERMAKEVYQALDEIYGSQTNTFARIASSEQNHENAVGRLLSVQSEGLGEYESLAEDLIARGSFSLADALQVGVDIENLDIADLQEKIATTENTRIIRVLGNLERGSSHHLSAFTAELAESN